MSLYNIALFIHILGVLGMFIAIGLELTGMFRMRAARTVEQVLEWSRISEPLQKVFPIVSLLILLPGLYMLMTTWGWTVAWINASLIGLVAMSVLGAGINGRKGKAIHDAAEVSAHGPISSELRNRINDTTFWTSVLTLTTASLGIIFLMTVKPDLIGTLVTAVISTVVGIMLGQVLRRPATIAAPTNA